ncbi:MAG: tautomerase family protein [Terriglobia bacterium]
MPYLSFHISADVSQDQSDQIASILTELTTTVLGKKRELISVKVNATLPKHWYIGGKSLASQSLVTFYLDIKVTEGTNTKNEKAEYIRRVFDAVPNIFGPLAPASYIVIHEVRADAWGYEGQTQESRYIRGKPL